MSNIINLSDAKRFKVSLVSGSDFSCSFDKQKNGGYTAQEKDIDVSEDIDMTREELDAKLAQNKAEIQAIASGMREEMAHWREEQNAQMGKIITTLSVLDVKLDERYENQKTASTRTQWMIGIAIAVAAIIPAVIALLK